MRGFRVLAPEDGMRSRRVFPKTILHSTLNVEMPNPTPSNYQLFNWVSAGNVCIDTCDRPMGTLCNFIPQNLRGNQAKCLALS